MSTPCRPSAPPVMSAVAVGDFAEHQRDAERHHQPGQIRAAQHQEAGDEAERRRNHAGTHQRDDRLVDDAVFRDQPGEISGDAEKRRLAQRDDAGIAEDEIERQREQSQDRGIFEDQILVGKQPDAGKGEDPERDLERRPAAAAPEIAATSSASTGRRRGRLHGHGSGHGSHRAAARANRPCGRQIKTTIMMA